MTLRDAKQVLLTLPFRSEWNATLLVDRALAAGKVVAAAHDVAVDWIVTERRTLHVVPRSE